MIGAMLLLALALVSCKIQVKLNASSIDYTKIKTITIADFPNRAALVYSPLSQMFTEELRDIFSRQTRLISVTRNGDYQLEGEITEYALTPMAIQSDAYAAETRLTVTVRVRFVNNQNHNEDFESNFSAYRNFDSSKMITDVQDELIGEIIEEITDAIFNKVAVNW